MSLNEDHLTMQHLTI